MDLRCRACCPGRQGRERSRPVESDAGRGRQRPGPPVVPVGSTVVFTYLVTNTGNIGLGLASSSTTTAPRMTPPTTWCRPMSPATRPTPACSTRRDLAVRRERNRRRPWCVRTQRRGNRSGDSDLGHSPRFGYRRQRQRALRPEWHRPAVRQRQRRRERHRAAGGGTVGNADTKNPPGQVTSSSTRPTTGTSATATAASRGATPRTRDAPGRSRMSTP